MTEYMILEAVCERSSRLVIIKDVEIGKPDLYILDCDFSMGHKQFIELPRIYRTERGARSAAARLVSEKLEWKTP